MVCRCTGKQSCRAASWVRNGCVTRWPPASCRSARRCSQWSTGCDALLDSFILHGDETEVLVPKEPGQAAQAKSWMWVQMTEAGGADGTGPPIRLFSYSPSRSTQVARTL